MDIVTFCIALSLLAVVAGSSMIAVAAVARNARETSAAHRTTRAQTFKRRAKSA
ncbi:hypothetical protein R5H30_17940 [Sulfitobacter sp. D35]|uniref:hypothetical protein n=1 Tax=Sulfitobacter sp. D35 TaxID=3083252 RepID=UPI00296E31D6|nr:hypothetical protein [Sulfitobacter sp. D35]MDW4499880.1 hypothetical protein [Sulfitobacter sp. D35]